MSRRKRYTPEEIINLLREAEVRLVSGDMENCPPDDTRNCPLVR